MHKVRLKSITLDDADDKKTKNEPSHEKTNDLGFRTDLTLNKLHKHRRWLEARKFGLKSREMVLW